MNRFALIRLTIAALLGAALAFALLAVISRLNADGGFALATVGTARGWTISVVAGLVSALLAWVLLQPRRREDPRVAGGGQLTCPVCGGVVGCDWRLCPHCGEMIR